MPLDIKDYAELLTDQSKLDWRIDEVAVVKVAKELVHSTLEETTALLGLKNQQLQDIRVATPDPVKQRYELLQTWKKQSGPRATFKALLSVCAETSNADSAEVIVQYLNGKDNTETEENGAAEGLGPKKERVLADTGCVRGLQGQSMDLPQGTFNLPTIIEELSTVQDKAYQIGVQLGLPPHEIRQFQRKDDDPLSSIIERWLGGNVPGGRPLCWQSVVEVLKTAHVREFGLANRISEKYKDVWC